MKRYKVIKLKFLFLGIMTIIVFVIASYFIGSSIAVTAPLGCIGSVPINNPLYGNLGYGNPGSFYGGYNPFSSVPSWIMHMMAVSKYDPSNPDITRMGYELSIPYFQAAVMSGWTPWRSLSYYKGYTTPGGYNFFVSMPYYSSTDGSFSFSYPNFILISSWTPWEKFSPSNYYQYTSLPFSSASASQDIKTLIGKVIGYNLIEVNGKIVYCWTNVVQAAYANQPLNLSKYMGMIIEVNGYLHDKNLYNTHFERVVKVETVDPSKPLQITNIRFTPIDRAEDISISEDGNVAWTCTGLSDFALLKLNANSGDIISQHLPYEKYRPQNLLLKGDSLYLITDNANDHDPGLIEVQGNSGISVTRIIFDDWRLYRTASACLSPEGRWIWLTSMTTSSSLYGNVASALFRIDLNQNRLVRMKGPPPNMMSHEGWTDPPENWIVSMRRDACVFAVDPKALTLNSMPSGNEVLKIQIRLGFLPIKLPREFGRYLPILGSNGVTIIDTETKGVCGEFKTDSQPTAVCVDSSGTRGFVAIEDSNHILQINLKNGSIVGYFDFSRPNGTSSRDSSTGKDTYNFVELRWADEPDRLFALGYDGYIFIVAFLD